MRDSVQQDIDRADKRLFGLKHMLGKWLVWDRDRWERKDKDKSGELKEVVEQQEKMRKQAAREAEEEEVSICPSSLSFPRENDCSVPCNLHSLNQNQIAGCDVDPQAKLCSRMEELAASQAALRLLRRCGTYPAVRHTVEPDEEDTFETDTTVAIRPRYAPHTAPEKKRYDAYWRTWDRERSWPWVSRLNLMMYLRMYHAKHRPGAVLVITKPSHRGGSAEPPPHVSFFDLDLARYRMMESLRGYGLGVTGGVALAEDLRREEIGQRLQVGCMHVEEGRFIHACVCGLHPFQPLH